MSDSADSYRVRVQRRPQRYMRRLPKPILQRIRTAIRSLAENPRPLGYEALSGFENLYRIRVGDWRVIYAIEDDELVVLIVEVGPRGQVYRNL